MAEFSVAAPTKKARLDIFDLESCMFCSGSFSKKNPPVIPDTRKLESLFSACNQRQDEIGQVLLENKTDILDGVKTFRYHRDCRSTYCSRHHIQRSIKQRDSESSSSTSAASTSSNPGDDTAVIRRSQLSKSVFDWKSNCFICGMRCFPSHRYSASSANWSLVATVVDDTCDNIYTKVVDAAEKQGDFDMLQRLRGAGPDLVAADARYHRKKNCLPKYIMAGKFESEKSESAHIAIIRQVKEEFYHPVMVEKEVYLLKTLRNRYQELAVGTDVKNSSAYTSQKLKHQLIQEWPELSFIPQPGLSDLVCSSEALIKVNNLTNVLNSVRDEDEETLVDAAAEPDEDSIVHMAVGILRRRIKQVCKLSEEYYSPEEMTMEASRKFVDPLLYRAIGWLTNDKLYRDASDISEEENSSKVLNITCDIVSLATSVMSPKQLGLSVHLHHEFGSRKLVDDMYRLGYGISYTGLRRFLTSAAVNVTSGQQPGPAGSLIPPELVSKQGGGKQVIAVGDNWDHNECTVDGKRTTHAMTSIIVTPQVETMRFPRLARISCRTYDLSSLPGASLSQVLSYRKPTQRAVPNIQPPPKAAEIKPDRSKLEVNNAKLTELIYNLSRSSAALTATDPKDPCPPWGPFHCALSPDIPAPVSTVAYNPILMANPTELATIYTTLMRSKEVANTLGHEHVPVFFDMGLLTKALEVTWSKPEELKGVIPCEGGMHLIMSIMAGIGVLYGDAGLRNLLHESGVFAAGTVGQILPGKDFARGLYALKLVDEALHSLFLKNFKGWCEQSGQVISTEVLERMHGLQSLLAEPGGDERALTDVVDKLRSEVDTKVLPLMNLFREKGKLASPTFKLWDEYLQRVSLPFKMFLAASRNGNWQVCQESKAEFLPLLFASNRSIYAKYMPPLLIMMKRLPPEIQQHFQNDHQFVTKLTSGKFNMVWPDYVLETTENKSLKGTGGIIGLTLRGSALARWFLARPIAARYSVNFHTNICKEQKVFSGSAAHHSSTKSAMRRWTNDVTKMKQMFGETYLDPFNLQDPPSQLVNFATGVVATADVQTSLLGALDKGDALADKFVNERLVPTGEKGTPAKNFYETMPRPGIKTMTEMTKTVKVGNRRIQMNAEVMYLRLLAINAEKQVPLERVMSFENAPVPLSMFSEDGTMHSGTKAEFMHKLEELLPGDKVTSVSDVDAVILDGHAVIQMLPVPQKSDKVSFKDMAAGFMDHVLRAGCKQSGQIHVVFDRYLDDSIKAHTREKRTRGTQGHVIHVLPDVAVPRNWKLFLSRNENKSRLAKFYTEFLEQNASKGLGDEQSFFISGGLEEIAIRITKDSVTKDVTALHSNQEEADTKMVLHAIQAAAEGAGTIVVTSPDTDVLVLFVHHRPSIRAKEIFFLTGHEGKHTSLRRYIPVHLLYEKLTKEQSNIILGVYCITGCDTVSAFHGHGKRTAFRQMIRQPQKFQPLGTLGSTSHVSEEERMACTRFVSSMYGKVSDSLNELRCEKAALNMTGKKLPPTDNSFRLHIRRSCYQLMVWKQASSAMQCLPDPIEYGYEKGAGNVLRPKLMSQSVSAPELLNSLVCSCEDYCSSNCTCAKHGQPCTQACICEAVPPTDEDNSSTVPVWCANPLTIEVGICDSDSDTDDADV